jgi:invasion protein IalB
MTRKYISLSFAAAAALMSAPMLSSPALAQKTKPAAKSEKTEHSAAKEKKASPSKSAALTPGGGTEKPSLLGQFGDWGAYTANPGGRKVCFALAKPMKAVTDPPNRPRDPTYMFISTRPAEKVTNEVSVVLGYGLKPSSDAMVEIQGNRFAMYTQNDGAWIKNAAEEGRLIEGMRKGADITVHGESARGTKTTDTYALKGLTQALERVAQECR